MGILQGSFSGRIWRTTPIETTGPRLADLGRAWLKEIERLRFAEIDKTERPLVWAKAGWVRIDDLLQAKFDSTDAFLFTDLAVGGVVALSVRVDEVRLQRKVFKALVAKETRAVLKSGGISKLTKDQREAIEETIKERLHKEKPPTVNIFETSWDLQTGIVAFTGGGSANAMRLWSDLFADTFDVELEATDPFNAAREIAGPAHEDDLLEALPSAFSPAFKDLVEED